MENLKFIFPIDGDCVNIYDGEAVDGGVKVTVKLSAPEGHSVFINEVAASYADGVYFADVVFCGFRNLVTAFDETTGVKERIAVFKLNDPVKKFRISSDDNILFLADITANKDVYTSIFDNPYLAMYKRIHDKFGVPIHLNLFYEYIDEQHDNTNRPSFNLSMMTDKFKSEFIANSDWLKLAFHSKAEFPERPYKFAKAEEITADCIKIHNEIKRFAGAECITNTTTVHFGEATVECVGALRSLGHRSLSGYFTRTSKGVRAVSYYVSEELVDHIGQRDFWYDRETDIFFGRIDVVMNLSTYDFIMDELRTAVETPTRSGFIELMIHEQYFYPDAKRYLEDFEKRVHDCCEYVYERGYRGALMSDMVDEAPVCKRI